MTATSQRPVERRSTDVVELVDVTIDGVELSVPKGTLVIRAAEQIGISIPRFCDHPLLDPAGACRQCLVEIPDAGNGRPMPKPQAACTLEALPGMVVRTQHTSAQADKAQHGVMELLLVNHPLDCPICDKGGECPLQNQALSNGRASSRFVDVKRTFPKPIRISSQVLLDRERCILCQRCTRFSKEIAGDPFIDLQDRGAGQQIGTFAPGTLGFHRELTTDVTSGVVPQGEASLVEETGEPFLSYFSGNTIQICPVGALTGAAYRFRSRPYDLVSTPGVCEHCASGCAIRTDHRRGTVMRRLAGDDPAVNEEWSCDKGRWAFAYASAPDRLLTPLVRDADTGELEVASWPEALAVAARGLARAAAGSGVGTLVGGRVTVEDAYAYAKFARTALHSNDIDFRARPSSQEEQAFIGHAVAGTGLGVTYADLEAAPVVLLAGLEPEEESPIVFLRLRKAVRKHRQRVLSVAPWATRGLDKLGGTLLTAAPGAEARVLDDLAAGPIDVHESAAALRTPGAVVLVGERLAGAPGALTAVVRLAAQVGARLAWVPRRAGERGAVEAGAMPDLLPAGRPVADAAARVDVAAAWGVRSLPTAPGRDTTSMLAAAASGELAGMLVGGVDTDDLTDPAAALAALAAVPFLVSLEIRRSAVTDLADVVLPVAPPQEKEGTFVDWEGRWRPFPPALATHAMSDHRVLDAVADQMDVALGTRTAARTRAEIADLGPWEGQRTAAPSTDPPPVSVPAPGDVVLSTWPLLLDVGRGQDGEPFLAGTAHAAVARVSPATADRLGLAAAGAAVVATARGQVVLPLVVTDMADQVVWLPTNSRGSRVRVELGATSGDHVRVSAAPAPDAVERHR